MVIALVVAPFLDGIFNNERLYGNLNSIDLRTVDGKVFVKRSRSENAAIEETTKKMVDLQSLIGHFLEKHYIKEIQYNVISNKIIEIQNIINSKSVITEELKAEIEEIISDGVITEKEYHHLIHLIKQRNIYQKN